MVQWPLRQKQPNDDTTDEQLQAQLPVEEPPVDPTDASSNSLPEEVREYFEGERQQHRGTAWLIGMGTLVTTLLLALVLFFGGRWAWRKVFTPTQPTSQQPAQTQGPVTKAGPSQPSTPPIPPKPTTKSSPTPTPKTVATTNHTPNTGPGSVLTVFILSSTVGVFIYQTAARYQTKEH